MTRSLCPAILMAALAVPAAALAQHSAGGAPSVGTAQPAGGGSSSGSSGGSSSSGSSGGSSAGTFASPAPTSPSGHRRGDIPANGTAVPRGAVPGTGGTIVITEGSGFYPWGYAGGIAGGFYGGYYGGYYGAYDPWYGWFPTYAPAGYGGGSDYTGAMRLKVTPEDASVYVDGFYVGIVDDFDGTFQRLRLDRGPHRIEMRATGRGPLSVDVMIQEDFTITYRGELPKQ